MLLGGLRIVGFAVGGFFVGVVVFNYLVMPSLIGHGAEVQVPDLIGRTLEQAAAILQEEGLELGGREPRFSSVYPDGFVVDQSPEPLAKVKAGHAIQVAISFGREGLVIPDLRGEPYREAQVSLSRTGLRLGRQAHTHHEQVAKDRIVTSAPEAGTLVAPGTAVDLLVSLGPRPVSFLVPELRGRQLTDVRAFFERSGIRLVAVPAEGDYSAPPGEIVGQRPAAGGRIRPQDVIEVDVSASGRGRWR
jgi:serine/threonine-protein kinase